MTAAGCARVAALGAVLVAIGARADPPLRTLEVVAQGACPDGPQVQAALVRALPSGAQLVQPPLHGETLVRVDDLGDRYRVRVGERLRDYADRARRCAERARTVAVFAVLSIEAEASVETSVTASGSAAPAAPAQPSSPPPPPPAAIPDLLALTEAGRAASPRRRPLWATIALAGDVVLVPAVPVFMGGASLRATVGRGHWGGAIGVTGLSPAEIQLGDTRVRALRVPVDADGVFVWTGGRVALLAELGLSLAVVQASGPLLSVRRDAIGLVGGVRGAVGVRLRTGPVSPFLALSLVVEPVTPSVVVDPGRVVGSLPGLFLGASLGAVVSIPWKEVGR